MPFITQKFIDDPEEFLKKYVVKVGDPAGKIDAVTSNFEFDQKIEGKDVATLIESKEGLIKAHFLRWRTKEVTSMKLDTDAKYFFTSQLTNCSFGVFGDSASPTVYHTAGTIESSTEKITKEKAVNPEKKPESKLATTNSTKLNPHKYTGQSGSSPSSAFVYGICKDGVWRFGAQVVAGNVEAYIPKFGEVPKILDPFTFKPWY